MNQVISIGIMLLLIGGISRTERQYALLWSFATPVFYILFGFKSLFVDLGFSEVELFSGIMPMTVCLMLWSKLTPTERKRAWKYSPKLWWLFLGYYLISLLWSTNFSTGIRTALEIAFPSFLYLIAFNLIQNDLHLEKYFKWMMIINVLVAIFDGYNAATGWAAIQGAGSMTEGVIGYRTVTAYFYVTMATILMIQMMDKFSFWKVALYTVNLVLLLLSASRTPTIVLVAGSLVAIAYRRNVKFAITGVLVLGLMLVILFALPTKSKFLNSDDSVNTRDSGRAFFQKYFEDKAAMGPIWGYGAGGSEEYAKWITQHITLCGAPHNEYLRIRFDGGIIGLWLFYLGLADLLLHGIRLGIGMKSYASIKTILVMAPVMFAVSCTNDNTFFYFYVFTQYLFVFMGFGARLSYEERVANGQEQLILDPEELAQIRTQMNILEPVPA